MRWTTLAAQVETIAELLGEKTGTCSYDACRRPVRLTPDGMVPAHRLIGRGVMGRTKCTGSEQSPAEAVEVGRV